MDGKSHFAVNTTITILGFGVVAATVPDVLKYAMTGLVLGTLITPDYDFKSIYIKSVINKIPVLGVIWNIYWLPYAILLKHRKLSHNFFFGTLTRVIYLFLPILLFLIYRNYLSILSIDIYIIYITWYLQDLSHYFLDSRIFSKKDD